MESFGIEASQAEERYDEPRRVRITRLPDEKPDHVMPIKWKRIVDSITELWDPTWTLFKGYMECVGRAMIGPFSLLASLSSERWLTQP